MEELRAVVDEAHAHGLPVVAHSHRPEEIRRGLAVGVDNFEHTGLSTAPEYPPDVMTMLRERTAQMNLGPLFWTPTIEGYTTTSTPGITRRIWTTLHGTWGCRPRSSPISAHRFRISINSPTSR